MQTQAPLPKAISCWRQPRAGACWLLPALVMAFGAAQAHGSAFPPLPLALAASVAGGDPPDKSSAAGGVSAADTSGAGTTAAGSGTSDDGAVLGTAVARAPGPPSTCTHPAAAVSVSRRAVAHMGIKFGCGAAMSNKAALTAPPRAALRVAALQVSSAHPAP